MASVSVLGIGWQLGSQSIEASQSLTASGNTASAAGSTTTTDAAAQAMRAAQDAVAAAASSSTASQSGTFTGAAVNTRFGNVQVSVSVANGAITAVTPLQLTSADRKSVQISARAEPILRSEVITAQSASVQNVSGATYTTRGYLQSLQSALDQAGF